MQKSAHRSVEQNALGSLLLTLVLAVSLIWMVAGTMERIASNAEQIVSANGIVDGIFELKESLVDMETGERGYIITGVEAYLEPHDRGLERVRQQQEKLIELLRNDPSEQKNLEALSRHINSKISISIANVEARRQGFEQARARVMEGHGKREMDAVRDILGSMAATRTGMRNELRKQRREMLDDLRENILVVAVSFIIVLGYLHWRQLRMVRMQHEADLRMQHLASHDTLTGLPNRRLMMELLEQSMQRCGRHKTSMALLFIDLNGFKPVNDKYGHEAGDEVLVQVAQRLSGAMRASDRVARLGGDEFLVLAEDVADEQGADVLISKINAEIGQPMTLKGGIEAKISASIGVAVYPRDGKEVDELLHNADTAMYEAKRKRPAESR